MKRLMMLAALLLLTAATPPATSTAPPAKPPAPKPAGTTSNCLAPPFLVKAGATAYTTPKDFALTRQADANCFAWQEFISLSWKASSAMRGQPDTGAQPSAFGTPNDTSSAVWETYKESNEVFLAG